MNEQCVVNTWEQTSHVMDTLERMEDVKEMLEAQSVRPGCVQMHQMHLLQMHNVWHTNMDVLLKGRDVYWLHCHYAVHIQLMQLHANCYLEQMETVTIMLMELSVK